MQQRTHCLNFQLPKIFALRIVGSKCTDLIKQHSLAFRANRSLNEEPPGNIHPIRPRETHPGEEDPVTRPQRDRLFSRTYRYLGQASRCHVRSELDSHADACDMQHIPDVRWLTRAQLIGFGIGDSSNGLWMECPEFAVKGRFMSECGMGTARTHVVTRRLRSTPHHSFAGLASPT